MFYADLVTARTFDDFYIRYKRIRVDLICTEYPLERKLKLDALKE